MKARFILVGLAAVALMTSCSIDEMSQTNDTNAISFKATVPYASRATATTTNNLTGFTVWGWTSSRMIMDSATATKNTDGSFDTSPVFYWPSKPVDFLALTPVADKNLYEANVDPLNGIGTVTVTVPSSYEDQIDFCYAYTTDQSAGTVMMNFRHALSQITFAAKSINEDWDIRIKGVKLCSVSDCGTYTLPSNPTTENLPADNLGTDGIAGSQGSWEIGDVDKETTFSAGLNLGTGEHISVPTDGSSVDLTASDGALFLIPQEVAGWDVENDHYLTNVGAYFRIECAIYENGKLFWPSAAEKNGDESVNYAEIAIPVDVALAEGYKYTYTFLFGEGAGYYPPGDENDPSSGSSATPVLGFPISFDVSVSGFTNNGSTAQEMDDAGSPEPDGIDYFSYIKDEYFLAYMQKFDRNEDSHLYSDELYYITELDFGYSGSFNPESKPDYYGTDFTGIEYYYNLQRFLSNTVKETKYSFEVENEESVLDLSNNTKLSYIYIPFSAVGKVNLENTSLTYLPGSAFEECSELTTVIMPDCLREIGNQAFYNDRNLTSVKLCEGLESIDEAAFYNCTGLKTIDIPSTVVEIGYSSVDKDDGAESGWTFAYCEELESIKLPEGMTHVDDYTFYNCTKLASVSLPTTLKSLDDGAFSFCSALTYVALPLNVETIGAYAFLNSGLTSIYIRDNVASIGEAAFSGCTGLTSVTFTSSRTLKSIENLTFYNCSNLKSIEIPTTVTEIGISAFDGCTSLKKVTVRSAYPPAISLNSFNDIDSGAVLYVPEAYIEAYEESDWAKCFGGGIAAIED